MTRRWERRGAGLRPVVAFVLSMAAPSGGQERGPEVFASGVATVRVDVLVTAGGEVVSGLLGEDFEVYDDGARQIVEVVRDGPAEDVHAVLALDTSESVSGERLRALREAASAFVSALADHDALTLLAFSGRVRWLAMPGDRRDFVRAALNDLVAGHNTVLNDAVYVALQMADPARGRPLVVILSDGDDRGSWLSSGQVAQVARASDVVVHGVRVRGRGRRQGSVGAPDDLLRQVADATGGEVTLLKRDSDVRQAFLRILTEFRQRYRLRFEPTSRRPGWHSLEVRVPHLRADVRARPGYVYSPEKELSR